MRRLLFLITGLFLVVISASLFAQPREETLGFEQIYQGDFPFDIKFKNLKPAHLFDDEPDVIVIRDSSFFEVLLFKEEKWESKTKIPFISEPKGDFRSKFYWKIYWTIGDLNDNGRDEIITCYEQTLTQYEWDGNIFAHKQYQLPQLVEDILVGDITNDGTNELVLFCYDEKPTNKKTRHGYDYSLCVARLQNGQMDKVWKDNGELGYRNSTLVPPDKLYFIADVEGVGYNQLVVKMSQSDASPSHYHLLAWDKDRLKRKRRFRILGGKMKSGHGYTGRRTPKVSTSSPARLRGEYPFSKGGLKPLPLNGEFLFFDRLDYGKEGDKDVILRSEDQSLEVYIVLFDYHCGYPPNKCIWMDIDGEGKGFLRLMWSKLPEPDYSYTFHRLVYSE